MAFLFRRPLLLGGLPIFLALIFSLSAAGQNSTANYSPPSASLQLLARKSGYIFDGTVLSVEPGAEVETGGVATVRITFRVEQAIRGVRNGQVLTIREWAGLWNSGERYRSGERLLLFLYTPGKLGLTSLVGGGQGRIPVDARGNIILDSGRFAALAQGPVSPTPTSPIPLPAIKNGTHRINSRTLALAIRRATAD
ncbi:MAG TPA: hypothetical protein VHS34_06115 [Terriglobales bacterium]|jgi:hypothetical protein|nr:hypothetical protein [Terriglobales bacterium]